MTINIFPLETDITSIGSQISYQCRAISINLIEIDPPANLNLAIHKSALPGLVPVETPILAIGHTWYDNRGVFLHVIS